LRHMDHVFGRADRVSRHAETTLDQVWAIALEAWAHVSRLGQHMKGLWGGHHVGNGARAASRPHHRRWTGTRRRVGG
jgi:hypothetical protein